MEVDPDEAKCCRRCDKGFKSRRDKSRLVSSWFPGPEFLRQTPENWPQMEEILGKELEHEYLELKRTFLLTEKNPKS